MISLPFRLSLGLHTITQLLPLDGLPLASEWTASFDDGNNTSVAGQRAIASEQNGVYKYTTATSVRSPNHFYGQLPTASILQQICPLQK